MAQFAVLVEGLDAVSEIENLLPAIETAAFRAINKTTLATRARAAKEIRRQVAFPASYLQPGQGRLEITRQAQRGHLSSTITARSRPTSLARFSAPGRAGAGVSVQVAPGKTRFMRRAFLIKLKAGTGSVETRANLGLAIRLRPGERLANKIQQVQLSKGLYLLYGPSVQQVFLDNAGTGVATDLVPFIEETLDSEFRRLLELRK